MMEYYMTWRVAGTVYHVERQIAIGNLAAILQPAIRFENRSMNSIAAAVCPQPGNPEAIRLMRSFYGHTECLRQRAGFSAMVNMAVGNENFLDLHAMLGCCSLQPTEIAARIDECALARGRAPQQCAVLRSEEHTSELQSLMRISYAVFCLKKKNKTTKTTKI